MIKNIFFISGIFAITLFSCKEDDSVSCVTCSQPQTLDFVLCEEADGNASVNGQNTGVPYNVYRQGLIDEGANCGGS